jgi:hypothetical protein
MAFVLDTNVPIVANGNEGDAEPACQLACIQALRDARNGKVLVDDTLLILTEYRRHLSMAGQPGVGDEFFKWLWENQGNTEKCVQVKITPNEVKGFDEFPEDPDLADFHADDRKFVAVALSSALDPEVLNAVDSDWWDHRTALAANNVRLKFVCGQLQNWQE